MAIAAGVRHCGSSRFSFVEGASKVKKKSSSPSHAMLSCTIPSLNLLAAQQQEQQREQRQLGQHDDRSRRREVLSSLMVCCQPFSAFLAAGRVVVLLFHMSSGQRQCRKCKYQLCCLGMDTEAPFTWPFCIREYRSYEYCHAKLVVARGHWSVNNATTWQQQQQQSNDCGKI
jgi:hypothetical protein